MTQTLYVELNGVDITDDFIDCTTTEAVGNMFNTARLKVSGIAIEVYGLVSGKQVQPFTKIKCIKIQVSGYFRLSIN